MGLIFGFVLAKGQHPFDDKHPKLMEEIDNETPRSIQDKRKEKIKELKHADMVLKVKQFTRQFFSDDPRIPELIEWIIKKERESRPTVTQVLGHPFLKDDKVPFDFSEKNLQNPKVIVCLIMLTHNNNLNFRWKKI